MTVERGNSPRRWSCRQCIRSSTWFKRVSGLRKGSWAAVNGLAGQSGTCKGRTDKSELRKSGEKACRLASERKYKMCGSLSPFNGHQRVPIAEKALNNQVDRMIHSIEMKHPLTSAYSKHAQRASEPSSQGHKDGSHACPTAGLPLIQGDLGITTTKCPVYQSKDGC